MEDNTTQGKKEEIHTSIIQNKINQEKNKKLVKKILTYSIIIIVIAILIYIPVNNSKKPGKYDDFAKCLTEKDIKMYGAYWCPACAKQKQIFGKSFNLVQYVECGIPGDKTKQTEICNKENIGSYPTWEINGAMYLQVQTFEALSKISGCELQFIIKNKLNLTITKVEEVKMGCCGGKKKPKRR